MLPLLNPYCSFCVKHKMTCVTQKSEIDIKALPGLDLEWNLAACAFPYTDQDVAAMKESMAAKGQLVPGKAWINPQTGKIEGYDGRIRQAGCRALGIPFEFEIVDLPDQLAVCEEIGAFNGTRRHHSYSQRAMSGARMMPFYAEAAKERQRKGQADLPEGQKGQARDVVAKLVNVSSRLIQDAVYVLNNGIEELVQAVDSGRMTVTAAVEITKLAKNQHKKYLEMSDERRKAALRTLKDKSRGKRKGHGSRDTHQTINSERTGDGRDAALKVISTSQVSSSRKTHEGEQEPEDIPAWILEGLRRHKDCLTYATSVRVTYCKNDKNSEIVLIRPKGKTLNSSDASMNSNEIASEPDLNKDPGNAGASRVTGIVSKSSAEFKDGFNGPKPEVSDEEKRVDSWLTDAVATADPKSATSLMICYGEKPGVDTLIRLNADLLVPPNGSRPKDTAEVLSFHLAHNDRWQHLRKCADGNGEAKSNSNESQDLTRHPKWILPTSALTKDDGGIDISRIYKDKTGRIGFVVPTYKDVTPDLKPIHMVRGGNFPFTSDEWKRIWPLLLQRNSNIERLMLFDETGKFVVETTVLAENVVDVRWVTPKKNGTEDYYNNW
jgi:hypothetical protein